MVESLDIETRTLSGGDKCIKYFSIFGSLLYFIIGCVFLALGISFKMTDHQHHNYIYYFFYYHDSEGNKMLTAILTIGCVITTIALVRFYGTATEKHCLLKGIFTMTLLMFVAEFSVVIYYGGKGYFWHIRHKPFIQLAVLGILLFEALDLMLSVALIGSIIRRKSAAYAFKLLGE